MGIAGIPWLTAHGGYMPLRTPRADRAGRMAPGSRQRNRLGMRHAGRVTLSASDRLDIAELLARYADVIDQREFSRVGEVFTPDARYDVSDFAMGVVHGAQAIAELWSASDSHPLAHHVTNIEISDHAEDTADGDDADEGAADGDDVDGSAVGEGTASGTARVRSRIIGVGAGGRVGSASYDDVVVKTADGWRIAERVVTLRTPDRVPPPS